MNYFFETLGPKKLLHDSGFMLRVSKPAVCRQGLIVKGNSIIGASVAHAMDHMRDAAWRKDAMRLIAFVIDDNRRAVAKVASICNSVVVGAIVSRVINGRNMRPERSVKYEKQQ